MKLLIKQRLLALGDTYDIYDEQGRTKYFVKAELLTLGHQIHVYDYLHNEVAVIRQELFTLLPLFNIEINGTFRGTIQKEFSFLSAKYEVNYNSWKVEGDFLGWDYDVKDQNGPIMHISKEMLTWGDTYTIDFINQEDELEGIVLVIAIDAANCSRGK